MISWHDIVKTIIVMISQIMILSQIIIIWYWEAQLWSRLSWPTLRSTRGWTTSDFCLSCFHIIMHSYHVMMSWHCKQCLLEHLNSWVARVAIAWFFRWAGLLHLKIFYQYRYLQTWFATLANPLSLSSSENKITIERYILLYLYHCNSD